MNEGEPKELGGLAQLRYARLHLHQWLARFALTSGAIRILKVDVDVDVEVIDSGKVRSKLT